MVADKEEEPILSNPLEGFQSQRNQSTHKPFFCNCKERVRVFENPIPNFGPDERERKTKKEKLKNKKLDGELDMKLFRMVPQMHTSFSCMLSKPTEFY